MKRVVTISVVAVSLAAIVAGLVVDPWTFFHKVFPVFLLWIGAWALNNVGLAMMVKKTGGNIHKRDRVAEAWKSPDFVFWFWYSFVFLVINNVAPFGLLFVRVYPVWYVLGFAALNLAGSAWAYPFRRWLWDIRQEVRADERLDYWKIRNS